MKKSEFEKQFGPEIMHIAVLIDPTGFGAGRAGKEKYWTVNVGITAWQDVSSGSVHVVENCRLKAMVENTDELRDNLKANSIVTVKARKGETHFLLKEVIESSDTYPELEKMLEAQLKPVYYEDVVLGTFTLDKSVKTFDNKIEWLGKSISVTFDLGAAEEMRDAVSILHTLVKEQREWDERARKFAAEELTDLANDWQDEDEEEGDGEDGITEEDFARRIILETISVDEDGEFTFWFGDDDIFYGHVIMVAGNLKDGFESADIAG
jgi:hypothetical protein